MRSKNRFFFCETRAGFEKRKGKKEKPRKIFAKKRVVRVRGCVRESILYYRQTPRVCRDVELAGVFWFRRDFPPGSGDGEVGGFPGGDDLSGKHARVDIAQPGASPSPRSPSAFRPATRMEPSLFQVIERMNKDRLGYAYAPRDVRASVMVTKLQLY